MARLSEHGYPNYVRVNRGSSQDTFAPPQAGRSRAPLTGWNQVRATCGSSHTMGSLHLSIPTWKTKMRKRTITPLRPSLSVSSSAAPPPCQELRAACSRVANTPHAMRYLTEPTNAPLVRCACRTATDRRGTLFLRLAAVARGVALHRNGLSRALPESATITATARQLG